MTLNDIERELTVVGIEDARHESLLMASHFSGRSIPSLMCDKDIDLDAPELVEAVKRRKAHEPLQYILGEWEFMSLPFKVSPDCLIPRADTELLTEFAISVLPKNGSILDLCTGSGCIAVSVAHFRPDATVTAVEKYPETLRIAEENGSINNVNVRFITGDINDGIPKGEKFDVIVSNPPYVTLEEMSSLRPELSFEPSHALTDGGDGLSLIEAVVNNYKDSLKDGGILAVEHGYLQGEAVRNIMSVVGKATTLKDLCGNDRVTYAKK